MKLDLRKTRAATVVDNVDEDLFLDEDKKASFLSNVEFEPKLIIGFCVRLALCALGAVGLRIYDTQNLKKLNAQKVSVNNELGELTKKQKAVEEKIAGFDDLAQKSKEFYGKLDIMQNLADERMLALTGLDQIQSSIPEEVWLQRVKFDRKQFTITGLSTTNKEIQSFVEGLENTELFSKVNLQESTEDHGNKRYVRRRFTIVSTLK